MDYLRKRRANPVARDATADARDGELVEAEQTGPKRLGLPQARIVTRLGDGMKGWPELAPFERIMVTAAAETMPETLIEQLSPDGGIMVLPVGQSDAVQSLIKVTRTDQGFDYEELRPVRFVPLVEGLGNE